mmetsp:Transcript_31740/g.62378  ORF Transcript_31740/g.62378 Transcript_31740/m.62378 type:complete len:209 (+) Transcript_31740:54-680(+)
MAFAVGLAAAIGLLSPLLLRVHAGAATLVSCDTTQGQLDLEINRDWSPNGADHFLELVEKGWFTDIAFYRAVPNFLVQFGINTDEAMKRQFEDQTIPDDPPQNVPFQRGTLSYAGAGANSRTNQVFISYGSNDGLGKAPWETPIGNVAKQSMGVLDDIYTGYGDMPPWGQGPSPSEIKQQGNSYIRESFPKVDFINTCRVVGAVGNDL